MVFLHFYTKLRLRRQLRRRDENLQRLRWQIAAESGNFSDPPPKLGLEAAVIASLPTFSYKIGEDREPIECSVCLGSVVEGSTVRELPNCKHLFHVECIDLWLGGSANCPNCRAAVEAAAGGGGGQPSAPPMDQEVVGGGGGGQVEKGGVSGSSSRLDSFRRIFAVGERSARHGRNGGGDEVGGGGGGEDLERQ
ncbi:RING-H2 finger protein ATL40 [Linum perenne]